MVMVVHDGGGISSKSIYAYVGGSGGGSIVVIAIPQYCTHDRVVEMVVMGVVYHDGGGEWWYIYAYDGSMVWW